MGRSSDAVGMVVQPWGCTWLEHAQLRAGDGCIAFEARGGSSASTEWCRSLSGGLCSSSAEQETTMLRCS